MNPYFAFINFYFTHSASGLNPLFKKGLMHLPVFPALRASPLKHFNSNFNHVCERNKV